MLATTHAIVVSALRYKDNSLIITCYTKNFGIQSYILHRVFKTKKRNINPAYFQLLSQLEIQVNHKPNNSLQKIVEVKLSHTYYSLQTNIYKSTVALFLAEILQITLKEEEENQELYQFIETALLWYDLHEFNANFHLVFLIKLSQHLGIYPNPNNLSRVFFIHDNDSRKISALNALFGTNFDELHHIKISAKMRQNILTELLNYFNLHLGAFKKPKSLKILHEIFN